MKNHDFKKKRPWFCKAYQSLSNTLKIQSKSQSNIKILEQISVTALYNI